MGRPQLVLDAAGVILTNFSASFFQKLMEEYQLPSATIQAFRSSEFRAALWTGELSEQQFWDWLHHHCPNIEAQRGREMLQRQLRLLPSSDDLKHWSEVADIHLLSNHRHEWLFEVLEPIRTYFQSMTISSQVGCCKPNLAIYQLVHEKFYQQGTIIYVDDQEKNLIPARSIGWSTVLADPEGEWIEDVSVMLRP